MASNDAWEQVPVGGAPEPPAQAGGWEQVPVASAPSPTSPDPAPPASAPPAGAGWEQAPVASPETPASHADIEAMSGAGGNSVISGADVDYLARKHGVDAGWLRDKVGWMAGILNPSERSGTEHITEPFKSTAGAFGASLGRIPQALYRKFATTPEEERALDDLSALVEGRQSVHQKIGDLALGLSIPMGGVAGGASAGTKLSLAEKTAKTAVRFGEAAGVGAAFGYGNSRQGDEVRDSVLGAVVGLGTAGAIGLAGGVARRVFGGRIPAEARQQLVEGVEDSVSKAEARWGENEAAEATLSSTLLDSHEVRAAVRAKDVYAFLDKVEPADISRLATLADPEVRLPKRLVDSIGEEAARAWSVVREAGARLDSKLRVGSSGGVADAIEREGRGAIETRLEEMRKSDYLREAIDGVPGVGKLNWLHKAAAFIADQRYVIMAIDDRMGTRLLPMWDKLSAQHNLFTGDMAETALALRGLNKQRLAAEAEPTLAGEKFDLYGALRGDDGAASNLTPTQKAAVEAWQSGFEGLRQRANKLGLPIEALGGGEGYVPKKMVDPVEFVKRVDAAGEKLGVNLEDDATLHEVLRRAEAEDPAAEDFIRALSIARGGEVGSPAEMREALNGMTDLSRVGQRLETRAGASFEREGDIPEFILEKDPTRLFMSWSQSTFRHIRYRGVVDQIVEHARAIQGDANLDSRAHMRDARAQAADYVLRHIQDLVGVREGSAAATQGTLIRNLEVRGERAATAAEKEGEATKAWFIRAASQFPAVLTKATANLYPYSLGLKMSKAFEYLMQPYFLGTSEFGLVASGKYFAKGTMDMIRQVTGGTLRREGIKKFLSNLGLSPAEAGADQIRWMRDGLASSPLARLGQKALDGFNHFALSMYEQGDLMGRATTYFSALRIAEGMQKGEAGALGILRKMPPSYRNLITEKMGRGEDVARDVAYWMNGYTQYNYNRVSMSEYGRYLGNLFSTFSKWPTSVFGDMAYAADRASRGDAPAQMLRLTRKYAAPFIALKAAQHLLGDHLEDSPRAQTVFGDHLDHMAPVTASVGLLNGPPIPRMAYRTLTGIKSDDPGATMSAAVNNVLPLLPGGTLVRLWYKDIPMYRGEDPGKSGPGKLLSDELLGN